MRTREIQQQRLNKRRIIAIIIVKGNDKKLIMLNRKKFLGKEQLKKEKGTEKKIEEYMEKLVSQTCRVTKNEI